MDTRNQAASHATHGASFFENLNTGFSLPAELPTQPTQPESSQAHGTEPLTTRADDQSEPAPDRAIYLRPAPELPSENEVYNSVHDIMEAAHAYGLRTGCDLVRHCQKTTAKGQPPYRWMMLCSRGGNAPATTPTIRPNTRSKKCRCPFGFWCIALDRKNPTTSQYRMKTSDAHNQHNHAPATFAELPNAKRRARRQPGGEVQQQQQLEVEAQPQQPTQAGVAPTRARPPRIDLQMDFRICVQLNPIIPLGDGPWGKRNWISFKGGQWTATWGKGTVEPGGQDSQIVLPDSLHTFVSTNYLLRTADQQPAFIAVQTSGWRTGPREVMERLFDPARANGVDPSEYSFKLSIKLETGDERYKDRVNTGIWVGSGARTGSEVIYDAYRVV